MRTSAARWTAGTIAVASVALTAGLVLAVSTFCTSYALRAIYVSPPLARC